LHADRLHDNANEMLDHAIACSELSCLSGQGECVRIERAPTSRIFPHEEIYIYI